MSTIGEVLDSAGVAVSEAEFARLVADVLSELGPEPLTDPRKALASDDQSALEAVGADLRPRSRNETDPRAASAAAVAAGLAGSLPLAWGGPRPRPSCY